MAATMEFSRGRSSLLGREKSMSIASFGISAALAIAGIGISVYGIANEHYKPTAIGLVLIFGSDVFATLCLASRRRLKD
jgi:divalent metal cation (Fe/Co/Zn/Cd) transporter